MASEVGRGVSRAPVNLDRLIMVGIPTFGAVSIEWHANMMQLDQPFNRSVKYHYKKGLEVGLARNAIVEDMLSYEGPLGERFSHVWFIDDDTLVPPDALVRLLAHQQPIMGGLYWCKTTEPMPCMVAEDFNGLVTEFTPGDIVECCACGMGCTLIAREVFERVERPWYKTTPNTHVMWGHDFGQTEDMYFLKKAREAGFKVQVDTSIACWHYDMAKRQGYPKEAWDRGDLWPFTPQPAPEREVVHAD